MPQSQQRDHGVTGEHHWLLDAELARTARAARPPRPALLRHEATRASHIPPVAQDDGPHARHSALFALGFVVAFAVYLLLRAADIGGAVDGFLSNERSGGGVVVTVAEPDARLVGREVATVRALLGSVPQRSSVHPGARSPRSSVAGEQAPQPSPAEEPVVPLQPPAPLPVPDPLALLRDAPQPRKAIEDLERATGLEPATLSLEG